MRRDAHQARKFEVLCRVERCQDVSERPRIAAALLHLTADVDLDEHRELGFEGGALVELAHQLDRIHGVNQRRERRDDARLIALQVADHMPAQVAQVAELGGLFLELLYVIFAEIPLTCRIRVADRRGRLELRYGDQERGSRGAPGCRKRLCEPLANLTQADFDLLHDRLSWLASSVRRWRCELSSCRCSRLEWCL